MIVTRESFVTLKDHGAAYEVWEKLRATYENTTPINIVN